MPILKKPAVVFALLAVIIIGGYFILRGGDNGGVSYSVAQRGDLAQEVSVTGRVKSAEQIDLAFDRSGRIARVNFLVGEPVQRGNVIVSLESGDLLAQLSQAEAGLKAEEAKLEELLRGTRPEELAVYEARVTSAESSLEEAKTGLINQFRSAYSRADDAVRNKADQLFSNPRTSQAALNFIIVDSNLKGETETERRRLEAVLNEWLIMNGAIGPDTDLETVSADIRNKLSLVESFLNNLSLIVNNPNNAGDVSATTVQRWKTDVSTARTSVETAVSNFSSAENNFRNAKSSLELAQKDLALREAGATRETIDIQKAQIESAEANINSIRAQIEKTVIRAPINGLVTRQEARVGEIASANAPLVSIISDAGFEIEADVYEGDVVKISTDNPVEISLVAFPRETFRGVVLRISPAEKIIDGVVYYEVTVSIEEAPDNLKPTMTADIVIQADARENVITVPRSAVQRKDARTIVEVFKDGLIKEREVRIGVRGAGDMVEIVSGLEEGEEVIIRQ